MRQTHPILYSFYMIFAFGSIGLGLNLLIFTPAFMPVGTEKGYVGLAFLVCGLIKLALLLRTSSNVMLQVSMSLSVFLYASWAAANIYDFVDKSRTSLQLPLFCLIVAAFAVRILLEPLTKPRNNAVVEIKEDEK